MESPRENEKIYEFGDFRLIPGEELLLHHGSPIKLNPKSFAVLVQLVEHHGHLVSKSEIMEKVWGDSFVEEGAIAKAVWFVRHALEDSSKERFIQTVSRRGYRFVAHVRVLNRAEQRTDKKMISTGFRLPSTHMGAEGKPNSSDGNAFPKPEYANDNHEIRPDSLDSRELPQTVREVGAVRKFTSRRGYGNWAVYAGFGAAIVAVVTVLTSITDLGLLRKPSARRVAVLPFKAVDPNQRDALYEFGITESLILKLAADRRLIVRPLSAVRPYVNKDDDPVEIGKRLEADHVLSSNYQVANGQIKVTSQWIDVATGEVEDAFAVEREAAGSFIVQDAIAEEIGKRLLARMGTLPAKVSVKRGTENEEAYRLYMQGMNLSEERGVQNVEKALHYLEQSVALDPNYALAWAGIALLHRDIVGHTDGDNGHYEKSMAAAGKALAIDPGSSDAYSALCGNKLRYEYDLSGAETVCRKALDLDPVSPVAHKNLAFVLASLGRFDEAVAAIKTAMDNQPVSYRNQQIYALVLFFARRHPQEEEQWRRLIELNPNHTYIYGRLSLSLKEQGKDGEAFEYLVRKLTMDKVDERSVERLRTAYASGGWRGVLEERIDSADSKIRLAPYEIACLYAELNEKDRAFNWLNKAFEQRSARLAMIHVEPQLDSLREDARFKEFVRKLENK